jgi:hypothetical protein
MFINKRHKFNYYWLFKSVILIIIFGWFVNFFTPYSFLYKSIFFILIFLIVYAFCYFLLNNVRRCILCGLGAVIYLLLRLLGLRESIYPILLIISLISIDMYFSKSR